MHELSIAISLVEQIVKVAEKNGMPRVDEIELETGVLRQVIPEMMQTAFQEATDGTIASGAVLKIKEVPAQARCRQCGLDFEPELLNFLCPKCQIADTEVLSGHEVILKSVSCEAEE